MARLADAQLEASLQKFERQFEHLPEKLAKGLQSDLVTLAEPLADMMRRLVPVDKGDLRDSITVTGPGQQTPPYSQPGGSRTAKPLEVIITAGNTSVRYAHLVEYGTRFTPPQPFFWPSIRAYKTKLKSAFKRAVNRAFKKAAKANG